MDSHSLTCSFSPSAGVGVLLGWLADIRWPAKKIEDARQTRFLERAATINLWISRHIGTQACQASDDSYNLPLPLTKQVAHNLSIARLYHDTIHRILGWSSLICRIVSNRRRGTNMKGGPWLMEKTPAGVLGRSNARVPGPNRSWSVKKRTYRLRRLGSQGTLAHRQAVWDGRHWQHVVLLPIGLTCMLCFKLWKNLNFPSRLLGYGCGPPPPLRL